MVRGSPSGRRLALTAVAEAYSATGEAWQNGPARVYDRLAAALVAQSPVPLAGRTVLDVGAGTGSAGRAARQAGAAAVVGVDASLGMLRSGPRTAAVGDAACLPFARGVFDAAVASFVINHLDDPAAGLREMRRVTRSGGVLLASVYAADDRHPVKGAVEAACAARGWAPPAWYADLRDRVLPLLSTADDCAAAMRHAGLSPRVEHVEVGFSDLGARDLVEWRLGLAQHAPWVASLAGDERTDLIDDAVASIGDPPEPLARSVLVLVAVSP